MKEEEFEKEKQKEKEWELEKEGEKESNKWFYQVLKNLRKSPKIPRNLREIFHKKDVVNYGSLK